MSVQFQAEDREFVTSTGARVTPNGRSTRFDGAPEKTSGLVITAKSDDPDPRLFEVGDTYDIAWDGGQIEDAEVIRSDAAGEGGIVGFSGLDQDGDLAFVLWTPDFDLQGWFDGVRGQARFYTSDQQSNYTHGLMCFAAEVRIATPYGPMPAGCLRPGHRILTLDRGPQVLRWVGHQPVAGQGRAAPVHIPAGAFGARHALRLSQQHRVMIADPRAEMMFGQSQVFVPAKALIGAQGVVCRPCSEITYVHLLLDAHHVVFAEGALCESLFIGPVVSDMLFGAPHVLPDGEASAIAHDRAARPILTYWEARALLDRTRADVGPSDPLPGKRACV